MTGGFRGQILDRPPILRGSVGPSKAPLAYRPTSSPSTTAATISASTTAASSLADGAQLAPKKEKGRFGVGAELRGQILGTFLVDRHASVSGKKITEMKMRLIKDALKATGRG